MSEIAFDAGLIRRYDRVGPRYTSYPTAVQFHEGFGEDDYAASVAAGNRAGRPLSLYVHIPFCAKVCFYCACNKVITANRAHGGRYLDALESEICMQAALHDSGRQVDQLHFGGGTPTFLSDRELVRLMRALRTAFWLREDDRGDYGIEIDPRQLRTGTLATLRDLGFNRISIGVQDVDPVVQRAVNRVQPLEMTLDAIEQGRRLGFHSISLDLIYGLPHQTVASFERTLDLVLDLAPDRLSVFNYAHMPHLFKSQRQINADALPGPAVKLAILESAVARLSQAGYLYIGMDHFARPGDGLARALTEGTLHRNFQGYSTHAHCDLLGLGVTAIGMREDSYSQNVKTLGEYYRRMEAGVLPVQRGVSLDADDRVRRAIITSLLCGGRVEFDSVEAEHGIGFEEYFAAELAELAPLADDGLVETGARHLQVTPVGRMLARAVAMTFDAHLQQPEPRRYSRVI